MSHKKLTFKHRVEYVLLRAFTALFSVVPYRVALAVGWSMAALFFHVVRFRRREAYRRIREALGADLPTARVRRIAWISLRNFVFNGVDLMRMGKVDRAWIDRVVDHAEPARVLRGHLEDGRGTILAIPHMGNWEFAAVACQLLGFQIFVIAGRQHNSLTDNYFNRLRSVFGLELLPRGDIRLPLEVIARLKQGKILGFLPDLRAKKPAMVVQFLGKPANVYGGMAAFARHARVPIAPAVITREGWGRHRWRCLDPIWPDFDELDREKDWLRMTQEVMSQYEAAIRAEPEQYFWYNTRWILDPIKRGAKAAAASSSGGR